MATPLTLFSRLWRSALEGGHQGVPAASRANSFDSSCARADARDQPSTPRESANADSSRCAEEYSTAPLLALDVGIVSDLQSSIVAIPNLERMRILDA